MLARGSLKVYSRLSGTLLTLTILCEAFWPERASIGVFACLSLATLTVPRAWRGANGTALRPAVIWGGVALLLALVSQSIALTEPLATGRPMAGHWAYLSVLATLAALISVLNARTPGGGAWAVLMALLVMVFLIPWLESQGLARRGGGLARLRLDNPWTIFYWLLVIAGVTNFLPTRYGASALAIGVGFALEFSGLTRFVQKPAHLGSVWESFSISLACALWLAGERFNASNTDTTRFDATWYWFRDHWGVVWALRVIERFNRSAELHAWPFRLTWHGLAPSVQNGPIPIEPSEEAEATLKVLLRRFATPSRLNEAGRRAGPSVVSLVRPVAAGDDASRN